RTYLLDGQERALGLNNRGPIQFDSDGHLIGSIRDAYSKYGFYIFEGVLDAEELKDIEADLAHLRQRLPTHPESTTDAHSNLALGVGHKAPNLLWSKPLGDPLGGTEIANGRHQVKLFEPEAADDAPAYAPFVLLGSLQFSEACLRVYGHPQLLQVAADIYGVCHALRSGADTSCNGNGATRVLSRRRVFSPGDDCPHLASRNRGVRDGVLAAPGSMGTCARSCRTDRYGAGAYGIARLGRRSW
ncbi:MAG: hypothetical protein AAF385_16560, partial [Pseudomonadota bacterium]